MTDNQILQKSSSRWKGITSLFLGIISLALIKFESLIPLILIPFVLSFFSALAGLIIGVIGLKTQKKIAIVGIIICIIALVLSIYFISLSTQLLKSLQ